ncbi:MAG: hypothetical protein ABIO67_04015 [Mycobacteriales bacterium]
MTAPSARRQPSSKGKVTGASAFGTMQLVREAEASVELDKGDGQTQSFDAPEVVELPDSKRKEYDRLLAAMPLDEPVYVAGNRAPRLKVGEYVLEPGDIVPGAHAWPRRETYERLGRIVRR